jgi:hypothetical protein
MFARNADVSMKELAVAIMEPKLQLPIAKAVRGLAHLLLIRGATRIESMQAIGITLNRNKSLNNP